MKEFECVQVNQSKGPNKIQPDDSDENSSEKTPWIQ